MRGPVLSALLSVPFALTQSHDAGCWQHNDEYDFIIVGGGTAGLVLATRLSDALPKHCIAVIEAGSDGRNESKIYIPGLRGSTFGSTYDWSLPTVPQLAANNRTITHNRGKVLGGTSALNLLVWNRATVQEFDAWEDLGNPGWGWHNMYPAMLKAENFQRRSGVAQYGVDGVGQGGPIQIALAEDPPPHVQAGITTLEALGMKQNLESLNGTSIGVMYQPASYRLSNHTRSYSVDYLPAARRNLFLILNSTVERVVLDKQNMRATGIQLMSGRKMRARKEIILSAGSLLSPQILELSGIGQKSVLEEAGVEQVVDLPGVGENLQDHLRIQNTYALRPDILGLDILKYNSTRAAIELDLWRQNQTSLYSKAGSCYGLMKWKQALGDDKRLLQLARVAVDDSNVVDRKKLSLLLDPASRAPDLEVIFSDGYIGTKGYPANGTTGHGRHYATLLAGVMHPFARGSVHINDSQASTKPLIDPRYLGTEYDLEATKSAARYLRKIATTPPFRHVWVEEMDPGLNTTTDLQWDEYVRENVFTFYHPLGTCAMLPRRNGGVVDPELRVYGVRNLRVVDASVIPMIISAHIQTAVYGIAERAASMIVAEYQSHGRM